MSAIDFLTKSLDSLAIKRETSDFALITYSAWIKDPLERFTDPNLSNKEIVDLLKTHLSLDIDPKLISQLIPKQKLSSSYTITPFRAPMQPQVKPNLLIIILSVFQKFLDDNVNLTLVGLKSSLNCFDVIIPRNPLKKILSSTNGNDWEVFASRTSKTGPLFIDRTKSYSNDFGTIGHQFEEVVSKKSKKYNRVYAVQKSNLRGVKIVLTGEIDCIDPETGVPVEIKTKPAWIKNTRILDTFLQCELAGVETVVTGNFTAQRGVRNGPVNFNLQGINYQRIEDFKKGVFGIDDAYDYAGKVLKEAMAHCKEVGVVYKISGSHKSANISIEECQESFAITDEVIDNCASAILGL